MEKHTELQIKEIMLVYSGGFVYNASIVKGREGDFFSKGLTESCGYELEATARHPEKRNTPEPAV